MGEAALVIAGVVVLMFDFRLRKAQQLRVQHGQPKGRVLTLLKKGLV